MKKEYTRRLRMTMKSEYSARRKRAAIKVLAVPVLINSFGIISWRLEEIRNIDT